MNRFKINFIFFSLLLLTNFSRCVTIDDELIVFFGMVENQSNSSVKIFTYDVPELPPIDSIVIAPGERKEICFYREFLYAGFACEVGRIKYVFSNGKGYDCTLGRSLINESPNCFEAAKDPFLSDRLPNNGNGTLLVITQEDFEMARDL
ncbi:hypothetical protein [Neolewinella agarilytica]|nr:hypothetical protein [Neolewinella agarilytica]